MRAITTMSARGKTCFFPNIIEGTAKEDLYSKLNTYKSMIFDDEDEEDLFTSYPEALNYLFRTYATEEVISQAFHHVISIKKAATMTLSTLTE